MTKESVTINNLENIRVSTPRPLNIKRQKMFIYLFVSFILLFIGFGAYWFFYNLNYISTDNAYVEAEVAEVTSFIEGVVERIHVTDTQHVQKGDILVVIDDRDTRLALKQAEAKFLKAETELAHTELNYKRRQSLAVSNLVSVEELNDTENDYKLAQANFQEASALKELAELNHTRTSIYAPVSGVVARREVQLGQRVIPGTQLLSIVPITNIYVSANFKENELRNIKPGQAVTLTSDKYGSKIKFHGHVQGFSGGTGAAFAIIPAQNATGNWVKVVQRLPVRITLDPEEIIKTPLEIGLSMHTKIDISENQ